MTVRGARNRVGARVANQGGSESEPGGEERRVSPFGERVGGAAGERRLAEPDDDGGGPPGEAADLAGEDAPPPGDDGDVVLPEHDPEATAELPSPARPRRSGAAAGTAAAAVVGEAGPALGGEASFGTWLRRQRELREIDLREIAEKTKISLRYLKAMEQDRFDILPAPVFARGFLREYAKYVGLNADEVVNYYLSSHHPEGLEEEAGEELVDPGSSRGPVTRGAFLVLLLIVGLALAAYFLFWRQSQEEARRAAPPPIAPPAAESVVPEGEAPPPPEEAVLAAPLVVTLDFTQECWVEARVDGAPELSRLFVAGESIQLEAEESVTLSLGNGGGVDVQVNNMPFDVGVGEGQIANLTIDLATVERLRGRTG